MALEIAIPVPRFGVDATYHRIDAVRLAYGSVFNVAGARGYVDVTLLGYATKGARDAGGGALGKRTLRLHFGAEISDTMHAPLNHAVVGYQEEVIEGEARKIPVTEQRDIDLITIKADEPTRGQIYAAIKQLPEFKTAIDA